MYDSIVLPKLTQNSKTPTLIDKRNITAKNPKVPQFI